MSKCNICQKRPTVTYRDGGTFVCCGKEWHYCKEFGKVREGSAHLSHPHPKKVYPSIYHECPKCGEGYQTDNFTCCKRNYHFSRSENRLVKEE